MNTFNTVWDLLDGKVDYETLEELDNYITFRGKTIYLKVDGKTHRVTPKDVIFYYYRDARNISSGCRSLGKIVGDWRPIDGLAKTCLEIYKILHKPELLKEMKQYDMQPNGW